MYSVFEDKLQNCTPDSLNKYLYNGKSEIEVNRNNSSAKLKNKNPDTIGGLITVEYASVYCVYIYIIPCLSWQ
jgi:hypothetical protein